MVNLPSILEAERDSNEIIKRVMTGWDGEFSEYSRFYHIATEDSHSYINAMGPDFTTTFTVGSSGDQGIECSRKGAKDVYLFDINRVDIYFLSLRKCALSTLKRKDFLDFMIAENDGFIMNYSLYQKLSPTLPIPTRIFWDKIYQFFRYNHIIMGEQLFRSPWKHAKMARVVNGYYANNKVYYETQEKIKNSRWHFITSDFYSLDKNMPEGIDFDAMILSNIYEYLNFGFDTSVENAKKYVDFVKNVLLPRVKENGTCMGAYLCMYDEKVDQFIGDKLKDKPNGWAPSEALLLGEENFENYLIGYTGQNVSYYYLLRELEKSFPVKLVRTNAAGYGQSFADCDSAVIIPKQKILTTQPSIIK